MHKTIVCRYDVNSTYIKSIVCRYDVRETEQARITQTEALIIIANMRNWRAMQAKRAWTSLASTFSFRTLFSYDSYYDSSIISPGSLKGILGITNIFF